MVGFHESNSFRLSLVEDLTQGPVGTPLAGVPGVAVENSGQQNENDGHHPRHRPHGLGGDSQRCRRSVRVETFILKKMGRVNLVIKFPRNRSECCAREGVNIFRFKTIGPYCRDENLKYKF